MPQEIFVDVSNLLGEGSEYCRWVSGPVLDRNNNFVGIISMRNRNEAGVWTNDNTYYAVSFDIGCTKLLYKAALQHQFSDGCANLSLFYPEGETTTYGFFGANVRDPNTAAFRPAVLNVKLSN